MMRYPSVALQRRLVTLLSGSADRLLCSLYQNGSWGQPETQQSISKWEPWCRPSTHRSLASFAPQGYGEDKHEWRGECSVSLLGDGSAVRISFDSDSQTVFHAPWLWSNDPTYVHPTSGQRLRTPGQYRGDKVKAASIVPSSEERTRRRGSALPIPAPPPGCGHPIGVGFKALEVENVETTLLKVEWQSRDDTSSSQVSYYDLDWLKKWRYDDEARLSRRAKSEVTPRDALRRRQNDDDVGGIARMKYSTLISGGDEAVFEFLNAIVQRGAALVQDAPLISSGPVTPVNIIGKLLAGSLSHGMLYGDIFHVVSMPDAHNIAYTSESLQPHLDLSYYESIPGLQLLHCVNNHGIKGGESVLVDALAAAEEFRRIAPAYFETLTKCPATFVKQRDEADMVYRRPHIVTDQGGEIVTVTWSPPFEGPLCLPPEQVEEYYVAYSAFERMVDNSLPADGGNTLIPPDLFAKLAHHANDYTWEKRLEPGEVMVFNNRRMLHGRRAFTLIPGAEQDGPVGRHLVGCYTNIDDTLNTYRILRRKRFDRGVTMKNAGNGSNAVQ